MLTYCHSIIIVGLVYLKEALGSSLSRNLFIVFFSFSKVLTVSLEKLNANREIVQL